MKGSAEALRGVTASAGERPRENNFDRFTCSALSELLRREQKYGTDVASAMSAIEGGTKPLRSLANEVIGTVMVDGKSLDLDWWITTARLNLTPAFVAGPAIGYDLGKTLWVLKNEANGTPRQNRVSVSRSW